MSVKECLVLVLGTPLCLPILGVELVRIWRAMQGEPLLITGLFGSNVTVQWSVNPFLFTLGMIFHALLVIFLLGALWYQFELGRRCLISSRG